MSCYRHLRIIEREKLSLYLAQGLSQREIARRLGRAPSTISREVRRSKGLLPWEAQTAYQERRRRSRNWNIWSGSGWGTCIGRRSKLRGG